MPVYNVPIGGTHFVEKQILNILRKGVPDPGIDDPNAEDGTLHGAIRDAEQSYTTTGDGNTTTYELLPTEDNALPVVAIYDVYVNGLLVLFGFDYFMEWGDKSGPTPRKTTKISFIEPIPNGQTMTLKFKYGRRVFALKNKTVALGSYISSGFSRGLMPFPKIQVQLENSELEQVGIGDNWDNSVELGNVWHNMKWRITVMSHYADEVKELVNKVLTCVMKASHENNYLMPILNVERIINFDYDIEQKCYIVVIMCTCKAREIFG